MAMTLNQLLYVWLTCVTNYATFQTIMDDSIEANEKEGIKARETSAAVLGRWQKIADKAGISRDEVGAIINTIQSLNTTEPNGFSLLENTAGIFQVIAETRYRPESGPVCGTIDEILAALCPQANRAAQKPGQR